MKLTNDWNLPQPIVDAVRDDSYSRGNAHASATDLILPSRIFALKNMHDEETTEAVADRVPALIGKVVHSILQNSDTTSISEKRLFSIIDEWTISGQTDRLLFDDGILQDWKTSTVDGYNYKENEGFLEWEQQLNIYSYLWRENYPSLELKSLEAVVILFGWSPSKKSRNPFYPPTPIVKVNIPMWSQEQAYSWIKERVAKHKDALDTLPLCSPDDRWHRGEKWAVMSSKRTRAVKLFDEELDASQWVDNQKDKDHLYIEHRFGDSIRCQHWCSVAPFCDQWQTEKLEREEHDASSESII